MGARTYKCVRYLNSNSLRGTIPHRAYYSCAVEVKLFLLPIKLHPHVVEAKFDGFGLSYYNVQSHHHKQDQDSVNNEALSNQTSNMCFFYFFLNYDKTRKKRKS